MSKFAMLKLKFRRIKSDTLNQTFRRNKSDTPKKKSNTRIQTFTQ